MRIDLSRQGGLILGHHLTSVKYAIYDKECVHCKNKNATKYFSDRRLEPMTLTILNDDLRHFNVCPKFSLAKDFLQIENQPGFIDIW